MPNVDVVTGAFGYTGRYITGRLLESGKSVKTLTGHPNRPSPFGDRVTVASFDFEDRRNLTEHLRGAPRRGHAGHPNRATPFGARVTVASFDFEDRRNLTEHLRGATTLYNTYWVRFPR